MSRLTTTLGLALLALASVGLTACSEPAPEPAVGEGWELVWNDEFDGEEIDLAKWSYETNCWGGGNNEQQCYTDRAQNSFLRDGNLVIHAQAEEFTGPAEPLEWEGSDPSNTATLPYTSARLRTKDKGDWTYGRIEVRAKVPGGQGIWPAIWMLPTESFYGEWAASGEIDIFEAVNLGTGDDLPVHGTLHYGAYWPNNTSSGTSYVIPDADPRADFHTYAIEWAAGEIRWYVDDVHYATQTSDGWYSQPLDPSGNPVNLTSGQPFDRDFHLLLNVAVGGAWPGNPDDTTELPVEMEVDFVRVWGCPATPETLEACATTSPNAEHVEGSQPVDRSNIEFDPDFINGEVVTVFDDTLQGPYYIDTWASSGGIEVAEVDDAERGTVIQFTYDSDESVAFFQSVDGFDFSDFATVEFDLKVVDDPRATGGGFMMKTDCFHPCGTGNVTIDSPNGGDWTSYAIPLADLVAYQGSVLDVTTINTPLVIFPEIGNQRGVVLQVDNVRLTR
jgi:beta-glucanase (GH16 family)